MESGLQAAILKTASNEPMAQSFDMTAIEIREGVAAVEMPYRPKEMNNLFGIAHGGAVFNLLDEAFQLAAQTIGSITAALNISYLAAPFADSILGGEAIETNATRKTEPYELRTTDDPSTLPATCQAVAYRTGKPLPFQPGD